jgi:hypothetical protein
VTAARRWTSVLLAALLVLQSVVAIATPCSIASGADTVASMETGGAHAGHHMSSSSSESHSHSSTRSAADGSDCCEGGDCSQGDCTSLSVVSHSADISPTRMDFLVSRPLVPATPDWSPDSLYRPPAI